MKKIKADLNSSYGYGFDNYISEYHQALYNIIGKHKMIYKNYNDNLKENISINMENAKDLLYKEIVEFIKVVRYQFLCYKEGLDWVIIELPIL